ncbi:glycosyl transferase group 1 [Hydrogenobacter thermophilus TK-6]|uniref:Glycosyltransferase, group 1 n=1 Tax=Hydrogenobacter thermophilus (strain DSM 6534 / IAM 12695 / TK-6) TaxID=608538 RepID=D3DI55_HYDTT|nr:glycosyltransferase family 4 protein [Hydrogenobacter thermophilus]ADO45436.1 glycosyl transferase group 1 [Hydrogenobacter thermophilus TK-6]BAI69507.1 glycosyltransferase, group 1 [Hydrogenobacter thermophilus TK-6]
MKSVIVHDWLISQGGAELVLEEIYKLYPSPIYTLLYDSVNFSESWLKNAEVHTSFIQKLPMSKKYYRYYLPLFPLAIEQFDLSEFDLIISSSHAVAKGVLKHSRQTHICYCHTPMRYAWDLYHQYIKQLNLDKGMKGFIAKLIFHYIRMWDYTSSQRVDHFVANSQSVAERIKKTYGRTAEVIYPPVDTDFFSINEKREDYYITVSRLVPYKRMDIIVGAFSLRKDKKLLVVGDGPDYERLKRMAGKNVEFLGRLSRVHLRSYLEKARAFVYMAEEDFGIAMVEAQACGIPVIAYGKGGASEVVINEKTGILFWKQTPEELLKAIDRFERLEESFMPKSIRANAERFSKEVFRKKFMAFVDSVLS